jgi:hypothetical protein
MSDASLFAAINSVGDKKLKTSTLEEIRKASAMRRPRREKRKLLILNGGQRRDRTAAAGLFRAA